jgi:hypothetical protein
MVTTIYIFCIIAAFIPTPTGLGFDSTESRPYSYTAFL